MTGSSCAARGRASAVMGCAHPREASAAVIRSPHGAAGDHPQGAPDPRGRRPPAARAGRHARPSQRRRVRARRHALRRARARRGRAQAGAGWRGRRHRAGDRADLVSRRRRLAAIAALTLFAAWLGVALTMAIAAFPRGLAVLGCGALALALAWYGALRRGAARAVGFGLAAVLTAVAVIVPVVQDPVATIAAVVLLWLAL